LIISNYLKKPVFTLFFVGARLPLFTIIFPHFAGISKFRGFFELLIREEGGKKLKGMKNFSKINLNSFKFS